MKVYSYLLNCRLDHYRNHKNDYVFIDLREDIGKTFIDAHSWYIL